MNACMHVDTHTHTHAHTHTHTHTSGDEMLVKRNKFMELDAQSTLHKQVEREKAKLAFEMKAKKIVKNSNKPKSDFFGF